MVDEQPRVAVTVVVRLLTERVGVTARRAPRRGEHVPGDGPRLTLIVRHSVIDRVVVQVVAERAWGELIVY
ncbi:hypothetical protein HMPREF2982_02395 [Propionibacterium sp. HMSC067A01]|nr:hypothetical protein HMPREF2982_02395 [Propionibacterium sp. HMSC067A01]